jgi:hypothetical protein
MALFCQQHRDAVLRSVGSRGEGQAYAILWLAVVTVPTREVAVDLVLRVGGDEGGGEEAETCAER